eukprot:CAMPEP_0113682894 /NCGR_PEP_ID=MMETSP0038_2-20120614/12947_1 /TAXON_ID=2898 /ORGANISM="Cryptomonas paramecium" /LENGTH=828 /DNA_ID=CAMNT_0000602075 /DNA_START=97 /DNA_END=2580 /DNA_ORIENTATION=- /assembly_acc=CAM_ASM_000170
MMLSTQNWMNTCRLEEAFKTEFIDDNKIVGSLFDYVAHGRSEWFRYNLYSPYGVLVQSSMSGKSRLLVEMASAGLHLHDESTDQYVFFISLANPDSTGFPMSHQCVRDFFLTQWDLPVTKYTAFLLACLEQLDAYEKSSKDWLGAQNLVFWQRVVGNAHKLFSSKYVEILRRAEMGPSANKSADGAKTNTRISSGAASDDGGCDSLSRSSLDASDAICQPGQGEAAGAAARQSTGDSSEGACKGLAHRFYELLHRKRNILFVFDGAGSLFNTADPAQRFDYRDAEASRFVALRAALSFFPRERHSPFALMTDTAPRICMSCPAVQCDRSARIPRSSKLLPPFCLVASVDAFAAKLGQPNTMNQLWDWRYYSRYGRPQWGACVGTESEERCSFFMTLARRKILGGDAGRECAWPKTPTEAAAILGIRACVSINPRCPAAHVLAARHMCSVFHISGDYESVVTGYFSEPALAQGAAQLLDGDYSDGPGTAANGGCPYARITQGVLERWGRRAEKFRSLLSGLQDGVAMGLVEGGSRGELVGRVLLLMGWDLACLRALEPGRRPSESGVFLRAVPVLLFLASVFDLSPVAASPSFARLERLLEPDGRRAWVRCTHFIRALDYVPDRRQLLDLFRRGAALITKDCQPGVDMYIPVYFCEDTEFDEELDCARVSAILVQCNNCTRMGPRPSADGWMLAPEDGDLQPPLLSLLMSMGTEEASLELIDAPTPAAPGSSAEGAACRCVSIAAFGLSPAVYRVVDARLQPLLRSMTANQGDPMRHCDWDCQRRLVRLLSPGQYKETAPPPPPARAQERPQGEGVALASPGPDGRAAS